MQSYDEVNRIKNTATGRFGKMVELAAVELEHADVASVSVGKLPQYGQDVVINGLVYRVKFVNRKQGEITLKLKGPDNG